MDPTTSVCAQCHIALRPEYYFCYNCGKNLHPVPRSTSFQTQLGIYTGSVLLAPMGLIWGIRYLRESNRKAKLIGMVSITLTILTLMLMSRLLTQYFAWVNDQVTEQLNGMQGF